MKEVVPIHKAALENLQIEGEHDSEAKQLHHERISIQTSQAAYSKVFDKCILPSPYTILLPETREAVLVAVSLVMAVLTFS